MTIARYMQPLLTDDYGELLYFYGLYAQENTILPDSIDANAVHSLKDLRAEVTRVRSDWSKLHSLMSNNLLGCPVRSEMVYHMGPFQLSRFMTDLNPKAENHIGEAYCQKKWNTGVFKILSIISGSVSSRVPVNATGKQ